MANLITARLELVAASIDLLEAELESPSKLSLLLRANVPEGWPPGEYDPPAMKYFLEQLHMHPDACGWYGWYAMTLATSENQRTLVGNGGFFGPPDSDGQVELGYSIVPHFEGQGYASEMVSSLVSFAFAHAEVKRIVAHASKENIGSWKVLEKNNFLRTDAGEGSGMLKYVRTEPTP